MNTSVILILVVAFFLDNIAAATEVTIPQGIVRGIHKQSYFGRTFTAFEGIPYAKPPVGNLRFASPEPAGPWDGILLANRLHWCVQVLPVILDEAVGQEDCLYMYVYTPRKTINKNDNFDVVVHIHGGAFMFGSPGMMAGPDYIMDKDIVFVSFNYRLNLFGFLSTQDNVVPGNNGLKDQVLALRWIKDNIRYFGGNPDSITITGQSAGACSVHYHYISPLSKGLFHRGWSESGTVLQSYALTEQPVENAKKIARHFKCDDNSTKTMVQCLRSVNSKKLAASMALLAKYKGMAPITPFGPTVETGPDAFLPDLPYRLLKEGRINDVPWIASNTKDEGVFPVSLMAGVNAINDAEQKFMSLGSYMLDFQDTVDPSMWKEVLRKIRQFYIGDKHFEEDLDALVRLFTDRTQLYDSEKAVRIHSKIANSPVYYYMFRYMLQMPPIFPGPKLGAGHDDDGRLLFKLLMAPSKLPSEDEKMMQMFVNFITTYASTGIPSVGNVTWMPVDSDSEELNVLTIYSPERVQMEKVKELTPRSFWDSLPIIENDKAI